MLRPRVIPTLLLTPEGLVKTKKFSHPIYVGDPINAVRIFNEKEVDELILLDITAREKNYGINYALIEKIARECFMPFSYGGGINRIEEMQTLFNLGVEKIILNSAAAENPALVKEGSARFGAQSIVASVDVARINSHYEVRTHCGTRTVSSDPVDYCRMLEKGGAGEIFLTAIDHEGTGKGYDCALIKKITDMVSIPVIACGGAASCDDFVEALRHGASAVAAGSMFVFYGTYHAVLISYPPPDVIENLSLSISEKL